MAKYLPEMKQWMEKRLSLGLNGNRTVEGTLRGYDQFMNIVLNDCVEVKKDGERRPIGMSVIRGNSILTMETLQRGS
ncbi:Sm protein, snRNP core protein, SmG [Chondrus crispus]|uniref:Small nuclear ribonucleoprotein G n=1 Tax=Chondrus crispus TaxID=2769 RepID=R7QLE2_CHOCR|nr:Sm protein, snRNP core protein, SmG [Chondrus crispus]CDF38578.1 Sm protein, snRNP core protein, SmG [Chondrus crispus]|eukprot:XP_005718483.1 Sm protein, snRNP core protein, SmG [Chondrus crispus]